MDPSTAQAPQPTTPAPTPDVPTATPSAAPAAEPKKSFLDSIMTMFGFGPKTEAPAQPETAAPEATPTESAPAQSADTTPPTEPTTLPQQ